MSESIIYLNAKGIFDSNVIYGNLWVSNTNPRSKSPLRAGIYGGIYVKIFKYVSGVYPFPL